MVTFRPTGGALNPALTRSFLSPVIWVGVRGSAGATLSEKPCSKTFFFGKHVFRGVPPFEVAAITRNGCLLCYRDTTTGRENFIWNGARFIPIRASADAPPAFLAPRMKVVDMNAKLQIIGQLEQAGRPFAAFLWEKDTLRLLSALIPQEYSIYLQSIVPLFISDAGEITFTATLLGDPSNPSKPQSFGLTLRQGGENLLKLKRVE